MNTPFGLLLGLVVLIGAFILEGGNIEYLLDPTALLVVFGGTMTAVIIGVTPAQLHMLASLLKKAFSGKQNDGLVVAQRFEQLAEISRRSGSVALEDALSSRDSQYLRKGLELVIDGIKSDVIRDTMEIELVNREKQLLSSAKLFEKAGGYAPVMGIIGTVIALIGLFDNMSDMSHIGAAFVATLYGVASANYFWIPMAEKLKAQIQEEMLIWELTLEGVLAIEQKLPPRVIRQKLEGFLPQQNKQSA